MNGLPWRTMVMLALACAGASVRAGELFTDDRVLDLRLEGPLGTLVANKSERDDYAFELELEGQRIPLAVRVRGNSRVGFCELPPLRLGFDDRAKGSVFEGQGRLKLVTHCRHGRERAENDVLDEYAAYRIFNAITPASYRVRLVRILYEDTTGELPDLERPHFGFLIEPEREMVERVGGEAARLEGAPYTRLDAEQVARMFVFQYLIGNLDYSLVTAEHDEFCCHNVDLVRVDDRLFTVPYDFDLSGLVNPPYAKPNRAFGQRRVTQRRYVGYCSSGAAAIEDALAHVVGLRQDILEIVAALPTLKDRYADTRLEFLEDFFEIAGREQKLLTEFSRDCIGRDYGRPAT